MRRRGSIAGPLLLIAIGVLFLLRNALPMFSVWQFFSDYWPYLLIIWGTLQIVEITARAFRGGSFPLNGISAGGWFLVLLISVVGFASYELKGAGNWWRRAYLEQGMDWFGEPHTFDIARQVVTPKKISRVVLEDFRGNAKIEGADINTVSVTGHKTIRALKDEDARLADAATPVEVLERGDEVVIRMNQNKAKGRVRVMSDLELTIPRQVTLIASGQGGDFDVSDIAGDVKISSDSAGVRLQQIAGDVTVDTRRGDVVRCIDVKGSVHLKGRSTDVELEKIAGEVNINGAYSGTITLRDLARPLRVDNYQTRVMMQRVIGEITMDRGSFSALNIVGPVQLTTHATDVEIAGFTDAIEINADKGDVSLRPAKGPLGHMSVRTGSGNIDLSLPDTAKFQLVASTDRGEIENGFGEPLKVETEGRGAKLVGSVGDGPDLNLTTERGTVILRKGDETQFQPSPHGSAEAGDAAPWSPVAPRTPHPPQPPSLSTTKL